MRGHLIANPDEYTAMTELADRLRGIRYAATVKEFLDAVVEGNRTLVFEQGAAHYYTVKNICDYIGRPR